MKQQNWYVSNRSLTETSTTLCHLLPTRSSKLSKRIATANKYLEYFLPAQLNAKNMNKRLVKYRTRINTDAHSNTMQKLAVTKSPRATAKVNELQQRSTSYSKGQRAKSDRKKWMASRKAPRLTYSNCTKWLTVILYARHRNPDVNA